MKILVSGGAGFIGSNFIKYWLSKNLEDFIYNLDSLTYAGNLDNLKELENNSNYQFVKGNILDREIVFSLVKNVDLIVHFAAESHVDRSIENSGIFVETNVLGTQILLEAARKLGNKRFHHISTDEVFGSLNFDDSKFNEKTPYDPRSPYSASKAASDHLVRAYYHTYGLPITISNCSNNYGPYQYPEKFIPLMITNLIDNKRIPIYGEGKNIRDWIYVLDHNIGVEKIIKYGKIGFTYCLGANQEYSNLDLAYLILDLMKKDRDLIEFVPDRLGHDLRYAIDSSLAQRELNFKIQNSFKESILATINWYRENEDWWRKLKNN
jgi:dTDP-glucose 4,6-dehydratase